MTFILTILAVLVLLVLSEVWWRTHNPRDEVSRKFIHITVGCFAATWPWYLSKNQILLMALGFAVGVIISKYLNVFQAIHAVQRPTWGEICFALAVGALALLTDNNWIYAIALLHMSLADGLAAIVGTHFGKTSQYKVFGHVKSVVGSAVFLEVSICLLLIYSYQVPTAPHGVVLVSLAALVTLIENIAVRGLDNLVVPLLVGVSLIYFA